MLKNRIWLGIILSIILLIFSTNGFAISYYKFTQESGDLFYVADPDKADALEDTNELRQIVSDLGGLLVHSKKNDTYPKDETTGGTLSIPNSALVSFATGAKGDIWYCSDTNVWTKLNIGADNKILVVATDVPNWETASSDLLSDVAFIAMLDEAETIAGNWVNTTNPWDDNEVADDITATRYYLKTEIDSFSELQAIIADRTLINEEEAIILEQDLSFEGFTADDFETTFVITDPTADRTITFPDSNQTLDLSLYYLKEAINTQEEMEAIWEVNLANDSELHTILTLGTASGLSLDVQELSLAINSDTSAGAVTSGAGQSLKVWKTDDAGVPGWRADEGGVAFTFLDASDTPDTYEGQGGKFLRVAGAENAIEFIPPPSGTGDVLGPETSVNYSIARFYGTDSKTIQDSLVFIDDDGSVDIPAGQKYKINSVALAAGDITGVATSGANVNITSLTGLTTPLALAYGGTGSVSAEGARTALGLAIGTNVQAYDAGLASLAGLTYASDSFIKVTATDTYAIRTIAETITDLALDSDDLSDVATIAMLDENETVTGDWVFTSRLAITYSHDGWPPDIAMKRSRDGDPTSNVAEDDGLGEISFRGYHTSAYVRGALIQGLVDGTPGDYDMPGRLEFLTTPDGVDYEILRMAIDSAGNIKMGDGAWTNYVNVTAGGAMTAEGTASIEATDLVIASQAAGDILYFNGTNWIRLAIGTAGQILTVNAGGTAPEWQTP